jgi:NAD-dependent dihydropyrimidine dehydrogenase PreA subunit/protein-S-isoprenylcysteine O-methyltransferase Ste14
VYFLPIDPKFQKNRKKVGKEADITIWGPVDPPESLGIRGTYVAVDWDLCTGCGICLQVCPLQLFEWVETSGHSTSKKKAFPAREQDCVQCYKCETQCPMQAIRIEFFPADCQGPTGWLFTLVAIVSLLLPIVGVIYGIWFGPFLGIQPLFYVGWVLLPVALFFFLSLIIYFRKDGKPGEGKGLMDTTVLVDSGTYAIVRHPMFLGGVLLMSASILISQHWLVAIVGVIISALTYRNQVKLEKGLLVKFGDDYKRYMEKVPRMNLFLGILRFVKRRREN